MNESILKKLSRVRIKDLFHLILFILALLPSFILKRKRPHLWLICEKGNEARDNGYWFYRYLRQNRPETDAVYAIDRKGTDYQKIKALGPSVQFGTFRHWIYYLAAEVNISSQKDGKPNAAVCYFLEVAAGILKNRRVFLQHGVIKDDLPFLHYDKAKFVMFCCGAEPEYRYVRDTFGYPEGTVQYTGLCRFDSLHETETDPESILIFPTWRMDLQRSGDRKAFLESEYYRNWKKLLSDEAFFRILRENRKKAVFCVHRNMSGFEDLFECSDEAVQVLNWQEADIEKLIRSAGMLITDYSSVFMDFAYQKKPILYYQFDYDHFRGSHLPEGYFDYLRDGFGPICRDLETLLTALCDTIRNGTEMSDEYRKRTERFFVLYDTNNSERTYKAVEALLHM